jgi:hypothetical protein
MKKLLTILSMLLWSGLALAQHSHAPSKGPGGGRMQDVAGVHVELVVSGTMLTLNVYDEDNKPLDTAGYTASIQVSAGGSRETVQLSPAGTALKGEAKAAPAVNAAYTVVLRTPAGKSGQSKF